MYLYLCADWKAELLKIGYSSKPYRRVKELNWEYQKKFRVIYKGLCEQQVELDLHTLLEDHRARIHSVKSASISKEIYHLDSYLVQKVVEFFTRSPVLGILSADNQDNNLTCRNCGIYLELNTLSLTSFLDLIKELKQIFCSEKCRQQRRQITISNRIEHSRITKTTTEEDTLNSIVVDCAICKEIISPDRAKILVTCSTKCEVIYRRRKTYMLHRNEDTIKPDMEHVWQHKKEK